MKTDQCWLATFALGADMSIFLFVNYKPAKVMDATSGEASRSSFILMLCDVNIPGAGVNHRYYRVSNNCELSA